MNGTAVSPEGVGGTAPPETDAPATAAIETRGLTKRYGEAVAVDHLDLRIEPGEVFGLLGPNGAGKTTTILMLLGLTEPTEGTARVMGLDPARDALAVKRVVGYLPDDVGFYDGLTGRQNLAYTAELNRLDRRVAAQRIDELLAQVDLVDAADRPVGGYSRGMRQRLGIADALVKRPSVLILDEPTVNIDPEGVREILALVRRLRDDEGMAIVLSSHLLTQVQQVCDRIGIFVAGRLAALGTVDELELASHDDGSGPAWELEVAVTDPTADLAAVLAGLDDLASVRQERDRWVVTAASDRRAEVLGAIGEAGLELSHLARRGADLDAVYHRYFREAS